MAKIKTTFSMLKAEVALTMTRHFEVDLVNHSVSHRSVFCEDIVKEGCRSNRTLGKLGIHSCGFCGLVTRAYIKGPILCKIDFFMVFH